MSLREKQKDNLTSRQWRLHDFLDDGIYEHWYSKEEIIDALPDLYQRNENPKSHDICPTLYKDSREIQHLCIRIQKILITNSKGDMKFGNKEETEKYCDYLYSKAMKKLEIVSILRERMNKDQQMHFMTNERNPQFIDEKSKAKQYYDVFPMNAETTGEK